MRNPRALITGASGQDAGLLADFLLKKNYDVYATYRRLSTPNFWRLQALGILNKVHLIPMELIDESSAVEAVKASQPDEAYLLASQSFVGASFEQPIGTGNITGLGTARMLEALRQVKPDTRIFQASTSEMLGKEKEGMQNEHTPFSPVSPYGSAKLYAHNMAQIYRNGYGMFICNGITYNHISPYRGLEFVSRKISNGVAQIKLGLQQELVLGNLEAKRDWTWAAETVEAFWLMLQQDKPDDYVIASGEAHSVREFAEKAFRCVGLDYHDYVHQDPKYLRPCEVYYHCGDASKAREVLGWQPKVKFDEIVKLMVGADLNRWMRWQTGEHFPWDAPNYPDEAVILASGRMER